MIKLIFFEIFFSGGCRVKFVWDFAGNEVHVCIIQCNGSQQQKYVQLKKSADGNHLEAEVYLHPGRCEFR